MYHFMKVYISLTSVNKYWGMKKNNTKKFFDRINAYEE